MREKGAESHPPTPEGELSYDEKRFFESFYTANIRGEVKDRVTLGAITDPEARFHYNATENAIIRAMLHREPPARGAMIETLRFMQQRRQLRQLDVGSGTGHWIDFFREAFLVAESVGLEITEKMAGYLQEKYRETTGVTILRSDIAASDFDPAPLGGPVDYVSAIGVMFHIVDDHRWEQAIANLASVLKPGGLMFVGGDFGAETRNDQFHKMDDFQTWSEHDKAELPAVRVNKRLRSLATWLRTTQRHGLTAVDLVRADSDPVITTAENDILVLEREADHD